jgi:hypothetical protein
VAILFALVSATAWSAFYADLLRGPVATIVLLCAGPVALTGLIIGIVHAVRRARPRWLPFVGIALSIGATVYIVLQFLRILAFA